MNLPTPFHLVPNTASRETVRALEDLLIQARRGDVIGIVYGVAYRGRNFIVGNTGEFVRNPGFGRQVVLELDDYLRDQTKTGSKRS